MFNLLEEKKMNKIKMKIYKMKIKKKEKMKKKKKEVAEEQKELSPEEELGAFMEQHGDFQSLLKMLKIGITIIQVEQKAQIKWI